MPACPPVTTDGGELLRQIKPDKGGRRLDMTATGQAHGLGSGRPRGLPAFSPQSCYVDWY
ncbi:MAG: hypothetical protein OJF52_002855 [Nitrospira sp.]|nr:MAG: hypothetical protein OJF52_002855 [Nitrospira sp.]